MDTEQDNGAQVTEEQPPQEPTVDEGGQEGGDGGDGGEEDAWATGGWLDEETGAGWGEEGGVQGGGDEPAPMDESSSTTTAAETSTTSQSTAGAARGGRGANRSGGSSGAGGGRGGGASEGGASDSRRGGTLSVGSMRGGYTSGPAGARGGGGRGGTGRRGSDGRGGAPSSYGGARGGPPSSSRQDYDRRYGPASASGGGGWEGGGRRQLAPMNLPPPTHIGVAPPVYYGAGGGDPRFNNGGRALPPPPGPYGAAPYHPQQQQQQQQQQMPMPGMAPAYMQQAPPHQYPPPVHHQHPGMHHPLHRGGGPPPTGAAGMAPIQSFQKFMLEQTDEPSAEESLQRYAEYKFKYIEDYAKTVFEEKKKEEWFSDRYLPTSRQERLEAKQAWAKAEAARFSRQLLNQPDLFVVSASLDPSIDLEYHALVKKYAKSQAAAAASSSSPSPSSETPSKSEKKGGKETPGANGAVGETAGSAGGESTAMDAKTLEGHGDATLFIRPFSSEVSRAPLEAVLRERGGPFVRLLLSDPAKNAFRNIRSAWLVYASKEEAEAARQALHNTEVEHPQEEQVRAGQVQPPPADYFRPFTLQLFTTNGKRTVPVPAEMSDPKRVEKDAAQSLELALALDKEKGLEAEGLQTLLDTPAVKAELGRRNLSFRLDVILAYLRRVHLLSYYGGDEFKDEGDLLFSAPQVCKRVEPYKPAPADKKKEAQVAETEPEGEAGSKADSQEQTPAADAAKWSDWTTRMDEKVAKLLAALRSGEARPEAVGLEGAVKAQQEAEEKAKQKWLLESMSNEDEGRWRCAAEGCTKLFKSSDFLQKHLLLKHGQGLEEALRAIRQELVRQAFDADHDKPLPPVQVDKGSGVFKPVPVGEVLAEVASVLGKDMSRWRQLIDESTRRRDRGGGGGGRRGGGGGHHHYGPRPAVVLGGVGALAAASGLGASGAGLGMADDGPPPPRSSKYYKDIDVPKSTLVTVDYGDVAIPPPPKRRRKKAGAGAAE